MENLTLLFVEDDKIDQLAFKRFVKAQKLPYQVTIAGSMAEAKTILSLVQFDLVITDYKLGDGSAPDLIEVVSDIGIPIIVVTGTGDEEIAVKMMKAGAYDYLTKDLDRNYLKFLPITVDNAIRHHRAAQQAHLLSHALMNIHESVCITDPAENIIFVNKGFSEMYGYKPAEVLGKSVQLLGRKTDQLIERKHVDEDYHKRKDGQLLPVMRSRSVLEDHQGKTMALVEITRDITERKQAEAAEKELARMKDEFVASVSHQLRTPLTSAKGFLDLLSHRKVNDPEVQQEFIENVANDVDHLIELVNDILDVFRLEAGNFPLELAPFDLSSLIIETLQNLEGLAGQKEISLTYKAKDKQPLLVSADRRWLREVLVNLLSNAIKFSDDGKPVQVTSQIEENQVIIKVIDQGPGIASTDVPKLFSKFYQADSAQKQVGVGTGLGLYISKKIIEGHSGQIAVVSELGQGSMFYFSLPLLKAEPLHI